METQDAAQPVAAPQDAGPIPSPSAIVAARAKRRVEALTWTPNDSAAQLTREITLGSQTVQKAFHLAFARAQIALYQTMAHMPFIADAKKVDALETIISGMIGKVEKEVDAAHGRLDALIKADGLTLPPMSFSKPQELQVNVFTPQANRFLRLMLAFDALVWKVEVIYMNGGIKATERTKLILDWKRLMYGLPRQLQGLWIREKSAVRRIYVERARENAQRDQAAAVRAGSRNKRKPGAEASVEGDADAAEIALDAGDAANAPAEAIAA